MEKDDFETTSETEDNENEIATESEDEEVTSNNVPLSSWWTTTQPPPSRNQASNIIDGSFYQLEGLNSKSINAKSILETFQLFFSTDIIELILTETNRKAQNEFSKIGKEWDEIDQTEFNAFLGILIFSGVTKLKRTPLFDLWQYQPGKSVSFFYSSMSRERFKEILRFIRFDNIETRETRLNRNPETQKPRNKLAAIDELLSKFNKNIQECYNPGPVACIDEQLQPFRGRCGFKVFMKSKPARYGLKYWVNCDAASRYVSSIQLYSGSKLCS